MILLSCENELMFSCWVIEGFEVEARMPSKSASLDDVRRLDDEPRYLIKYYNI